MVGFLEGAQSPRRRLKASKCIHRLSTAFVTLFKDSHAQLTDDLHTSCRRRADDFSIFTVFRVDATFRRLASPQGMAVIGERKAGGSAIA